MWLYKKQQKTPLDFAHTAITAPFQIPHSTWALDDPVLQMFLPHTACRQVLLCSRTKETTKDWSPSARQAVHRLCSYCPLQGYQPVSGAVSLGVLAFHEGERKKGNSFFLLLGPLGTFKMKTVCSRWLFDSDSGHIHTGGSNCGIAFISGEKRSKNKCPTISALKITASDAIFLWQLTL